MTDAREQEHRVAAGEVAETSGKTERRNSFLPAVSTGVYFHYECTNPDCTDAVVIDVRTSGKRPSPPCTACGQTLEWSASTPCDPDGCARNRWMLAPRLRFATTAPRAQGDER